MPPTFPSTFGSMFTTGLASAGAAAAIAGTTFGAQKIWDAATKASDFKAMLAFDPELAAIHKHNPKYTMAAFNTLRNSNTDLSKDPMVAAAFVRQVAVTGDPSGAFGLASEALRTNKGLGPIGEAFHGGIAPGLQHSLRQSTYEEERRNKQLDALELAGFSGNLRGQEDRETTRLRSGLDVAARSADAKAKAHEAAQANSAAQAREDQLRGARQAREDVLHAREQARAQRFANVAYKYRPQSNRPSRGTGTSTLVGPPWTKW